MSAELTDVTAAEGLRAKDSETQPRRASFARERSRLEPAEAEFCESRAPAEHD